MPGTLLETEPKAYWIMSLVFNIGVLRGSFSYYFVIRIVAGSAWGGFMYFNAPFQKV